MTPFFSPAGEAALATTMALSPLLVFDFDGTLAPIVPRPEDATVPEPVARRLQRLATRLPVAIVTGRAVADVKTLLPFTPRYVLGNHGAEDPSDPAATPSSSMLDGVRAHLALHAAALREAGVRVEDKGQSIALHYRLATDRPRALALVDHVCAGLGPGVASFGGKEVMNLTPRGAPDKADAVVSLLRRSGAGSAVFVGDDVNDEPVFARAAPGWLTVKVGNDAPESRAAFFLEGPHEMAAFLDRVLASLSAPAAAPARR